MPAPPAGPAPAPAATVQPTPVATATPPASANAGSPPAGAPEPPKRPLALVLDTDILDDLQAMLGEEVDRLIDVFLDDTPRLIKALENAAAGPDYDALRDAAHSLKSSAANLGAMSLSAAAKRVELAAREKSLERPAVAVALIANEFARARQQMLARRPAQQA
ncbi:Hpt domain-containing protein [Luteimonas marina]|uniref:Hpt domain-containing protein n=2 Tax=Luteimonas marina TaxID=488485 RepID=A0A5C5U0N4_9GAMM|nr:Hpt domain-containing protein [Luteimonas marina]